MSAECSPLTSRPAIKQTEVGVIPEDWDIKPIAEVLSYKSVADP